jgi:hypothetical protein
MSTFKTCLYRWSFEIFIEDSLVLFCCKQFNRCSAKQVLINPTFVNILNSLFIAPTSGPKHTNWNLSSPPKLANSAEKGDKASRQRSRLNLSA